MRHILFAIWCIGGLVIMTTASEETLVTISKILIIIFVIGVPLAAAFFAGRAMAR